jgi:hypothetical protein
MGDVFDEARELVALYAGPPDCRSPACAACTFTRVGTQLSALVTAIMRAELGAASRLGGQDRATFRTAMARALGAGALQVAASLHHHEADGGIRAALEEVMTEATVYATRALANLERGGPVVDVAVGADGGLEGTVVDFRDRLLRRQ